MRKQSCIFFFTLIGYSSSAQLTSANPAIVSASVADTVDATALTTRDAEIYNGQIHVDYLAAFKGTAYYLTNDWQQGSVLYHNIYYKGLLLRYDLVRDEVVVKHYNGFSSISLFTPRVQAFSFSGSTFIYLEGNGIVPGFYEELKKGRASLYAKRTKFIKEGIVSGQAESEFIEKNTYYLLLNGVFHQIKKQKDLLALLKEKREEITASLKNDPSFKDDLEAALKAIVESYNQSIR